ncbi:MAG TPA: CHAT domain-containing protein [Microcoleaceae cyanobacterium]|jgi:CHAT domain-containing protein/Flp pilus assembly protein TadD
MFGSKSGFSQALIPLLMAAQFPYNAGSALAQIPRGVDAQVASACNGWEDAYKGRYQQALDCFQNQLTTNNPVDRAQALYSLGWVYSNLGQYKQALAFYQQALALQQQYGTPLNQAYALGSMGWAYYYLGQYSQAIAMHKQALALRRSIAYEEGIAFSLGGIGRAYSAQGNYQAALPLHQEQLAIAHKIQNRREEAYALSDLGFVYAHLNQAVEAQRRYEQAIVLQQQTGDRWGEAISLSYLGDVLRQQQQPELAIAFYKRSVKTTESIRQDIQGLSYEQRESYTRTIANTYRVLADLLLAKGRILEAQQVLELLKVQELKDFTRNHHLRGNSTNRFTITPAETKILQEHGSLIAFGQTVEQCKQTNCPKKQQLVDQLDNLTRQYNQTVASFEQQYRERRAMDDAVFDPRQLGDLRQIVESQLNTVLIYPFVLEKKTWLLWVAKGGVFKSVEVPVTSRELGEAVLKFREAMSQTASVQETQLAGMKLYNWLIKPLEPELKANKINNLVFSLDRVTRYIPMSALFDGQHYLIENYTVSTVLSVGLTRMQDRLPAGTQNTPVLAVGASNFKDFLPLPNVPQELDSIVYQHQGSKGIYPGQELLNQDFTYPALKLNLGGHKILHIATHGAFVPGQPEDSYLVLGNDRKLTTEDIKALSDLSQIHLVVLSACETALGGPDQNGVEISGISSYFLTNGVATVIASLWSVSDESTSLLMQRFYGYLAQSTVEKPVTKAQALRLAQLSLLYGRVMPLEETRAPEVSMMNKDGGTTAVRPDSKSFVQPFYWAPFILIGNEL